MTAALTAEGLHTYYGKSHILHGVSLEVAEGKITALLGRNGAGKTTTLRSLMGLTPARDGRITILGEETTRWPTFRIAASGVGYVPEGRRIFTNLSVDENLKVPLERGGPWTIARIWEVFRVVSQMRDEGISVLLVEQNARMSLEVADHAYVLDDGGVVYSGNSHE